MYGLFKNLLIEKNYFLVKSQSKIVQILNHKFKSREIKFATLFSIPSQNIFIPPRNSKNGPITHFQSVYFKKKQ